ncbi:MAG: F0F1 ATP synthase subunit delta [Burkholderiales bacterium]|nr:F0F1 ATP synthase subunit delta [Burkholderiales bacterium]
MAEISTVARPYAEAAFKLARASGSVPAWSDLVSSLGAIAADPQVASRLDDPGLQPANLVAFFGSVLPGGLAPEAKNFVLMLAENGRIALLPEIAAQFHGLRNAAEGRADLVIESAFALEGAELAGLVASLEKKFARKLNYSVVIVPELIGGVRVTVGDEVLDASVRGRLAQMATALQS